MKKKSLYLLPLIAALVSLLMTFGLFLSLLQEEEKDFAFQNTIRLKVVEEQIRVELRQITKAFEPLPLLRKQEWNDFIKDIQIVYPSLLNVEWSGLKLPMIPLQEGSSLFTYTFPLLKKGETIGKLHLLFDGPLFLKAILPSEILAEYGLSIYAQGKLLYKGGVSEGDESRAERLRLDLLGWEITLTPKIGLFKEKQSPLPLFTLCGGVAFSLFFAALLYLFKTAKIARKEAERASRAKSLFLANMSHEIRTPLCGIIGVASLLKRSPLPERERRYVDRIEISGKLLLDILSDILDISKIEEGKLSLEKVPCDLYKIALETKEFFSSQALEKGIPITLEVEPSLSTKLYNDPMRLRQILLNLVGNALKFTEKGHIALSLKHKIDQENKKWLRVDVEDTGIGIPLEKQELIFQTFVQGDMATTRRFGGTGLGLSISKQLVEKMGGKIGCHSKVEKGSTFYVEIPINS